MMNTGSTNNSTMGRTSDPNTRQSVSSVREDILSTLRNQGNEVELSAETRNNERKTFNISPKPNISLPTTIQTKQRSRILDQDVRYRTLGDKLKDKVKAGMGVIGGSIQQDRSMAAMFDQKIQRDEIVDRYKREVRAREQEQKNKKSAFIANSTKVVQKQSITSSNQDYRDLEAISERVPPVPQEEFIQQRTALYIRRGMNPTEAENATNADLTMLGAINGSNQNQQTVNSYIAARQQQYIQALSEEATKQFDSRTKNNEDELYKKYQQQLAQHDIATAVMAQNMNRPHSIPPETIEYYLQNPNSPINPLASKLAISYDKNDPSKKIRLGELFEPNFQPRHNLNNLTVINNPPPRYTSENHRTSNDHLRPTYSYSGNRPMGRPIHPTAYQEGSQYGYNHNRYRANHYQGGARGDWHGMRTSYYIPSHQYPYTDNTMRQTNEVRGLTYLSPQTIQQDLSKQIKNPIKQRDFDSLRESLPALNAQMQEYAREYPTSHVRITSSRDDLEKGNLTLYITNEQGKPLKRHSFELDASAIQVAQQTLSPQQNATGHLMDQPMESIGPEPLIPERTHGHRIATTIQKLHNNTIGPAKQSSSVSGPSNSQKTTKNEWTMGSSFV